VIIVAIDPSPTHTGMVALHRDTGLVVYSSVFAIQSFRYRWAHLMDELWGQGFTKIDQVIVERPPASPARMTGESNQTIGAYWHIVWTLQVWGEEPQESKPKENKGVFPITSLSPGSWKPAAKGWGIKKPAQITTRHEFDAFCMIVVTMKGEVPFERQG
jgi:hypothetical protein